MNKPPLPNGDHKRDPDIKALKRRGVMSTLVDPMKSNPNLT